LAELSSQPCRIDHGWIQRATVLHLQQVANLTQQYFFRAWRSWQSGRDCFFTLEAVDRLDAHENRKRHDHEVDHRLDKLAIRQHHRWQIALGTSG